MTGYVVGDMAAFVEKVTIIKMSATTMELLFRGILCNILVCLAVWCTYRVKMKWQKFYLFSAVFIRLFYQGLNIVLQI